MISECHARYNCLIQRVAVGGDSNKKADDSRRLAGFPILGIIWPE